MQLEFEVKNQTVKLLGDYELVKGSKNYLVAHFTFSDDWESVSKKMVYFTKNSPDKEIFVGTDAEGGTKIGYTLDSNNSVLIPPEFIQKSGFNVNLTGVNEAEQEVITTNPVTVYVTDNGLLTDETEGKTLPEYLEEKLQDINKAVSDTSAEAEAAAKSAEAAETAQEAAKTAQAAAEAAKAEAYKSKQAAAGSATAAAKSASDASGYADTANTHKQGAEAAKSSADAAADLAQKWAESDQSPDGAPDSKSAKSWATAAGTSATAAKQSADTASSKASEAATSADDAATSAGNAAGSATTAGQHASTANTKANKAAGSATLAQKWAESSESPDGTAGKKSAKTWAEEAAESASAAESSKTAAAQSANAAAQSATEAGNAATEAVGNPVTSVTKDGNNIKVQKKDGSSSEIPLPTVPGVASQSEAEAGTENTKMMTALRTKQATAALVASVTESNGTVTVKKKSGSANTFIIIKTINGKEPTNGNFDIKGIPLDTNGTISPWQRNGIYRGKNLGTITSANIASFLSEHEVSAGKFTDLYVGDEITIQDGTYNAKWLIAGFDTEYNKGDTAFTTHHITLIPKTPLYDDQMNSTDTTAGGYKGSAMHTTKLPALATKLQTALGTHLLTHRAIISNAVNTEAAPGGSSTWKGMASGWEWTDVKCVLPTEVQVYGGTVFSSSGWDTGEAEQKLPVFNFINPVQFSRWTFWLRCVASSTNFCICSGSGDAGTSGASNSRGVRPLICVG